MNLKPNNDKQFSAIYVVIACLFVCFLMIANITAGRLVIFGKWLTNGDLFLFPLTYIFGDILTEVYGFKKARLVIWIGMLANIIMSAYFILVINLPYPSDLIDNEAYKLVLGLTPRIVLASVTAFFVGQYSNSVILSVIKKLTNGKKLYIRTIGSTLVGELLDTAIFMLIAFSFLPTSELVKLTVNAYIVKVAYEVLATPLTYWVINRIKKLEDLDTFDFGIKYTPF